MKNTLSASRREFLRRTAALSATGVAAPWALNLAAIGEAAAQSASDYKALVCVFLYGGNDHGNTLVPYDSATYNSYRSLRGPLALDRSTLAANVLVPDIALGDSRQYALPASLAPLKAIFEARRMGVLLNIGTLIEPTTKAAYDSGSVRLPPRLFSHNDQQSVWQASNPEGATSGWGGRMGDLFSAGNGGAIFTAVSVSGNAVYLSGNSAVQYQVTPNGSVAVQGLGDVFGSATATAALRNLITTSTSGDPFEREHVRVMQRSIDADAALRAALGAVPGNFPATPLGKQLAMVSRLIAARDALQVKRQVFFVSLGGFDHHDSLLAKQPGLLVQVAEALAAFDASMLAQGTSSQVTSFTGSDFGRTLSSNGDGSDHGWGGFQFVMGGAVQGRRFFGTPPLPGDDGPDDVGQGRMLPTMAVDQLASTLARWMGVSDSDLTTVVPGIGNYGVRDLGLFG